MPKPGDRVIIEGTKLGAARREGVLLEQIGSLIKVRWTGGGESLLTPGAGAVRFEPGKGAKTNGAAAKKSAGKAAAKPKPVAKAGAKKPAARAAKATKTKKKK